MSNKKYFNLVKILSVIGIFLAIYLYSTYLTRPENPVCTISETVNCDAVTKGSLATFFGIPVALVGLTGYVCILFASFLKNKKAILAFSLFGTLFCLRLTFLEIFSVKILCPVCMACQIDMLALVILSFVSLKSNRS
jgi:uncharacterized membrane protein